MLASYGCFFLLEQRAFTACCVSGLLVRVLLRISMKLLFSNIVCYRSPLTDDLEQITIQNCGAYTLLKLASLVGTSKLNLQSRWLR